MRDNVDKDELEPTDELINGDSEIIKDIAAGVKGWAGNWDAVYDNILLRAAIKKEIVYLSEKFNRPDILEAEFNSLSNTMFHQFSKDIQDSYGLPEKDKVFALWKAWALDELNRR